MRYRVGCFVGIQIFLLWAQMSPRCFYIMNSRGCPVSHCVFLCCLLTGSGQWVRPQLHLCQRSRAAQHGKSTGRWKCGRGCLCIISLLGHSTANRVSLINLQPRLWEAHSVCSASITSGVSVYLAQTLLLFIHFSLFPACFHDDLCHSFHTLALNIVKERVVLIDACVCSMLVRVSGLSDRSFREDATRLRASSSSMKLTLCVRAARDTRWDTWTSWFRKSSMSVMFKMLHYALEHTSHAVESHVSWCN